MVVLTYLVLLQVWCRLSDICWWESPGRTHHTGRTWTPAEGKTQGGFLSRRREHREGMFQLWRRTRITHRVPPGLQQGQFPRSDRDMDRNEELMDGWMMEDEAMMSTYMDSSSLLAHRLTVEPSFSRTTMRFSLGLFSGGATSVQHQRVKQAQLL